MSESGQQQSGGQRQQQQQQPQQQQPQQQQLSPAQALARALTGIRQAQSWVELNHPQQANVIAALRESGDLVWRVIQGTQQQQQQQQQRQQGS
jgi:GH35 family endo-1,4-beta-xylanase